MIASISIDTGLPNTENSFDFTVTFNMRHPTDPFANGFRLHALLTEITQQISGIEHLPGSMTPQDATLVVTLQLTDVQGATNFINWLLNIIYHPQFQIDSGNRNWFIGTTEIIAAELALPRQPLARPQGGATIEEIEEVAPPSSQEAQSSQNSEDSDMSDAFSQMALGGSQGSRNSATSSQDTEQMDTVIYSDASTNSAMSAGSQRGF